MWEPPLTVTLSKSCILVLHFPVDVKDLYELGKRYPWPKPSRCSRCGSVRLWGHGFATRYFEGFPDWLWVQRFRCPECNAIHTCRPLGFLKGIRYSAEVVFSCLLRKITESRWVKGVERQNQQYWYRCLRLWRSRRCNVRKPSIDSIASFFSGKILPVTEQCAQLRL